jgi:hypothetical protein
MLDMGFKPAQIISMGFKSYIVYAYNRRYKAAKEELLRVLAATKEKPA